MLFLALMFILFPCRLKWSVEVVSFVYFRITVARCELSLLAEVIRKLIGTKSAVVLAEQTK